MLYGGLTLKDARWDIANSGPCFMDYSRGNSLPVCCTPVGNLNYHLEYFFFTVKSFSYESGC